MKGRIGLLLGICLVVILVVAAVVVGYVIPQRRQPPPFDGGTPGSLRLTYPDRRLPNRPVPVPRAGVRLALIDVTDSGGKPVATINVFTPNTQPSTEVRIGAGQSARVGSVTIRVEHAYNMPNPAHDAADVVVTPTT